MKKLFALLAMLLVLVPASLSAQEITQQKLRFAAGRTQANISSTIRGRQTIDYIVGARRGQTMSIRFSPDNSAAYFNLLEPGTGRALFVGQSEGNPGRFAARLGASGDYVIRVYLVRSAARRGERSSYDLSVSVTGAAPQPQPEPPSDDFADGNAGGPDFWVVSGLSAGDALNGRRGPSATERVIATYRNGKILTNLGCRRIGVQRWCKVQDPRSTAGSGWVNGRFLRESAAPGGGGGDVGTSSPDDALVPGTNYNATGEVDCAIAGYPRVRSCPFGVTRDGGSDQATLFITLPDGENRSFEFANGAVRPLFGVSSFRYGRTGDSFLLNVNGGGERYTVDDAVVYGG